MSELCPHCGAKADYKAESGSFVDYECGTTVFAGQRESDRYADCYTAELAQLKKRCERAANELRESTKFVFSSGDRNPHCESHLSYAQRQKLANELSPPTTATPEKERE